MACENHAIADGSFWWWAPYCWPGWNAEGDAARLKRELAAGVISLKEAHRLFREGLA